MTEIKSTYTEWEKKENTFKELEAEIIKTGKCCSCGACIAYCESQNFNVIEMDGSVPKFKSKESVNNCIQCGICYYICPQTNKLMDALIERHQVFDDLGYIKDVIPAKTTNKAFEEVVQDGGIATTILAHLFDRYQIDAAIVSEYNEELKPIPKIIYNKEDLIKSAGTRYSISSQILPLKDLYNISSDIIKKNRIFDIDELKLAFIGSPCQCRAISKMKLLNIKPAHVIKYVISLFCFENFDYDKLYDILEKETGISRLDIKKSWIKKNFFILTKDNKEFEIDIKKLDKAVRGHCLSCKDFTGMFSDLSVGAAGAPPNHTMIVIRTETGHKIIKSMYSKRFIEQYINPEDRKRDWKSRKINWFKRLIEIKHS